MQRTPRTSFPATPRRATATLALCVAACLAVTGCATPPSPPVAPDPALDARARYDADLQDCRDRAQQVGVLSETLDAVVQGALVAAF
ncbi:MAG: glycine zipper family protein, partial [Diaphorobacter sp.]|nr:glycine zipper family protein [Diaphorobacter sp.]